METFSFRLTPKLKTELAVRAKQKNMKLADYVRWLLESTLSTSVKNDDSRLIALEKGQQELMFLTRFLVYAHPDLTDENKSKIIESAKSAEILE